MEPKIILSTGEFIRFMLILKAIFKDHKRKEIGIMEFRINNEDMLRAISNQLKRTPSWMIRPD